MGRREYDPHEMSSEEKAAWRAARDARRRAERHLASGPKPTMGQMREGHYWLWVNCTNMKCNRRVALPLTPLVVRWGAKATSDMLRACARCTKCGAKGVTLTTASWGGEDVGWVSIGSCEEQWTGKLEWHPDLGAFSVDTMCNLYSMTKSREAVRAWFKTSENRTAQITPLPAIFPRTVAPVVRLASDGERELVQMTWGFPLIRKGYAPKPVTNVRDDKVLTSPFWRPSFEGRRCLVPASSYCEPDSNTPAGWHWFALLPPEERPLFAFPGIWKRYKGPMKKDGPDVEIDVYAFMTTTPNELTATIMHDRMPVLLSDEHAFDAWLKGSPADAYGLVQTYAAEQMRIVQSGKEKEDRLGASAVIGHAS